MSTPDTHTRTSDPQLVELAKLYGVLPRFRDSRGVWRESSSRSIYQALAELGAAIDPDLADATRGEAKQERSRLLESALLSRKMAAWDRMLEPVLVAWDGVLGTTVVRSPSTDPGPLDLCLRLDDGVEHACRVLPGTLRRVGEEHLAGRRYSALQVPLGRLLPGRASSGRIPAGYHRLLVTCDQQQAEATVISAPRRCWSPPSESGAPVCRPWGVFAPTYALRSERDWGAGDLADLSALAGWVAEAGGSAVATLPLLAAFLDTPFEPAPYRPVSRLFWNEFYLAPERTEEWRECAAARRSWGSSAAQEMIADLRSAATVDYRGVMEVKRRALESLAAHFFAHAGEERREAFSHYLETHPWAVEYAAFRSRGGASGGHDTEDYHLYSQWQMAEQLELASGKDRPAGPGDGAGLFLDVPVGVHPHGFDTWRWRDAFVHSMSTGAPPDALFSLGQVWDTPPPHPERMRNDGHQYLVAYLREQMRYASYLRIDHFMGLHRLFCIPAGSSASDGVYVTYPAEEQYAVLALESHRSHTVIVGEDLGTVPPEVRRQMRQHGVLGTWVLQLALHARAKDPVAPPTSSVMAAVNTHDTFPFAGFARGDDIAARVETGQVDPKGAHRELAVRHRLISRLDAWLPEESGSEDAVGPEDRLFDRVVSYLARSRAAFLLVNIEDLWAETRPQNQPGTGAECGNWERKLRASEATVRPALMRLGRIVGRSRASAYTASSRPASQSTSTSA